MARQVHNRDISSTLAAAKHWIDKCLNEDHAVLSENSLWTVQLVDEVYHAFVEHPDYGADDFTTKLKGQIRQVSLAAQQLVAEMLWVLLLFPSNMKARVASPGRSARFSDLRGHRQRSPNSAALTSYSN